MMARRNVARAVMTVFVALVLLAAGPVGIASATVTMESSPSGTTTKNTSPTFSGSTEDFIDPVMVHIYEGTSSTGPLAQTLTTLLPPLSGTWELTVTSPLPDGTYTAIAEQSELGVPSVTEPITFMVDTTPPEVSMNPVASPRKDATPTLTGGAGIATGDDPTVTVTIYEGASTFGNLVGTVKVAVSGSTWTAGPVAALSDGTYTAQVAQGDEAGNIGKGEVTFTVDTTVPAVGLTTPANNAFLKTSDPTFSGSAGSANGDGSSVTLNIYAGTSASGPHQTIQIPRNGGSSWAESEGPQLPDGTYTVQAEQSDEAGNTGVSSPHTFAIKTGKPVVTLSTAGFTQRGSKLATPSATPSFSGSAATASDDSKFVTLNVYSGSSASGTPIQGPLTVAETGGTWSASPAHGLPDGTYTAQAEQKDLAGNTGVSASLIFTVDTTPPHISLASPAEGSSTTSSSQLVQGSAGTAEGDLPRVTIQLFAGGTIGSQASLESIAVNAMKSGSWSATFGGLEAGVYTVRAEQSDDVDNLGLSPTTTFTVLTPAPVTPTPPISPTVQPPTTATPLAGQPSTATFAPSPATPRTMLPFPIVRIVGSSSIAGAKLSLLTVQAPSGAEIAIRCRGRGCPKAESRVVASRRRTSASLVEFRRFERSLPAGAVLEIRVWRGGEIGKYTRFTIRRGKPPARVDTCLSPAGAQPIACPQS